MKKIILSSFCIFVLFVVMQSCQKEVHQSESIKEITIDTTLASGIDYFLNLAPFGDEDDIATILEKGKIFSVSQLENETDMFTSVYHYSASAKTSGTDRIVLSVSENPGGRNKCSKDSTIIYLNLTIK